MHSGHSKGRWTILSECHYFILYDDTFQLENNNLHYPHILKIDTDNNMEYLSEGQIVVIDILAWDYNSGKTSDNCDIPCQ